MPLTLYAPGERKGNKAIVARGSISGQVYEFSTGTTDQKVARRLAREFEAKVKAKPASDRVTFSQAADRYSQFKKRRRFDLNCIDRLKVVLGKRLIRELKPADLHDAAEEIAGGMAPATKNRNVLRPAISILHHASRAGLCEWIRVDLFPEPRPKTRALDLETAAALIADAEDIRQRRLLIWLFFQGSRISAALRVQWSDITPDLQKVRMWNFKGDREEEFALHELVIAELSKVKDRTGPVFPWSDRSSIRRWLGRLRERTGVHFTAHVARHTLGTALLANKTPLKTAMLILGHSQERSTLRYQSPDVEIVRSAVNSIQLPQAKKLGNVA